LSHFKWVAQNICKSGKAEPLKSLIAVQDPVGGYANSTPITTIWVCSIIDLSWPKTLVNPHGKIDTVEKKIVPAAKSKPKEESHAGCNKGSSVLSPSTGGAQGALKKYGSGTNGCAQ